MLQAKMQWELMPADELKIEQLADEVQRDRRIIALCYLRGLQTKDAIERFLDAEGQVAHDPFLLLGMEAAVARIRQAVADGERIRIYGDYDADGVTATTIVYIALQSLGARVDYAIPDRFRDGYGLNERAIRQALDDDVALLVTVDTGISAAAEVELATALGIDVVVTDHHEPSEVLPAAVAVVNPKQAGCTYPYPQLCGAGIALKLAEALVERIPEELYAFAAIGTIADLVPLLDENRLIAIRGLAVLARTTHPGLTALLQVSGIDRHKLDADRVAYGLSPRINAAGRLAHADLAVRLFTTTDIAEAEQLAQELQALNLKRQQLVRDMEGTALAQAQQQLASGRERVLVVAHEDWHEGVIGIVAAKLVERYYRPVVVLAIDSESGTAKGSARSIEGFDLFAQLGRCADVLIQFGGHTMAAGLSIDATNIEELRDRLEAIGREVFPARLPQPRLTVDLQVTVGEITLPFLEQVAQLAPFGEGNRMPLFLLRNVDVVSQRKVGSLGEHLKWVLRQDVMHIEAMGFQFGEVERHISLQTPVHVVAEVGINEWNGTRKPQLIVRDIAITEQQIFDYRGKQDRVDFLHKFQSKERPMLLNFRTENEVTLEARAIQERFHVVPIRLNHGLDEEAAAIEAGALATDIRLREVIVYDLPTSYAELQLLRSFAQAERIYVLFGTEMNEGGMTKLPDRERFKWFYAYLLQNKTVALDDKIWEIVKWKNVKEAELRFMAQVFLELELVTVQEDKIVIVDSPHKREFTDSRTYVAEQERLTVESELLFSPITDLAQWFKEQQR